MTGGYASLAYVRSFLPLGEILPLRACGGHLIVRNIDRRSLHDLSGCYPLFSCNNWLGLAEDLASLSGQFVTVSLVTDPFCTLDTAPLGRLFDVLRPLSRHYVVDLTKTNWSPSRHHLRSLRVAARSRAKIEIAGAPAQLVGEWSALYDKLAARHDVRGIRRFSPSIFAEQLAVPGTVLFTARRDSTLLGADWYLQDGDRVYGHLAAFSQEGYATSVSYLLQAAAIEHFRSCASIIDLGGIPSVSVRSVGGLAAFKAGWATGTLPSYLCGAVLMPKEYAFLTGGMTGREEGFFPLYRQGDYG
jgi:hypothetical protein